MREELTVERDHLGVGMAEDLPVEEEIKRLPLSEDLLQYYRARLEAADKERASMIESLKVCDVKHADMHQLQWMLSEREEEVLSLQHAAKQQQLQVVEQQEQLLELRAENRQLRIQEAEDRKRIQQLLSLTKPVQQEVTFMRDVRPSKLTTNPAGPPTRVIQQEGDGQSVEVVCPGSMGAPTVKKGRAPLGAVQHQHVTSGGGSGTGGNESTVATRVLRTVYLPSEKTDSMLLTIDALQRELDEYKRVGEEKMSVLMEQRDTAMAEGKVQVERLLARVAEVEERASTLSTLLRNNEKEYLLLRHNTAVTERVMKEDNIGLQEQNKALVAKHEQDKKLLQEEHQQFAEELGRQTETYVHTFRSHATAREKERDEAHAQMVQHKTKHEETKGALEQRIEQMAEKIGRLDKVRKLTAQQKKWEAAQNAKDATKKRQQVDMRPGRGGTASRATLLYDRYVEGARAEVLAEGMSEDEAGVEEVIVRRAVGAASHGGIAGGGPGAPSRLRRRQKQASKTAGGRSARTRGAMVDGRGMVEDLDDDDDEYAGTQYAPKVPGGPS